MRTIDPDYRGRLTVAIRDPYQMHTPELTGVMEEFRDGRAIVLRLDPPRTINGRTTERAVIYPSAVAGWQYEEG